MCKKRRILSYGGRKIIHKITKKIKESRDYNTPYTLFINYLKYSPKQKDLIILLTLKQKQ